MPSDKIHVGCQVGKVYRVVVQEEAEAFTLLGVLSEYVAQPKKKSQKGGEETLEESTARHSSPKAWVIAVIPVPEAFAPFELGLNIDANEDTYPPYHTATYPQLSRSRQHSLCRSPLANGNDAAGTQNHCTIFFCTGRGAMCAERHKSPCRIRMRSVRK